MIRLGKNPHSRKLLHLAVRTPPVKLQCFDKLVVLAGIYPT